jgi:2-polyprenyl-3-methyl-5-hydroxy-6-metoxy-1,4-benzoquinol methylase/uncharacterized protein YbaR (Trm112 family)
MKTTLLPILRCPSCQSSLSLVAYEQKDRDIMSGLLKCERGHRYAIWKGVPRMHLPEVGMPAAFVDAFRDRLLTDDAKVLPAIDTAVSEFSFSSQWSMYQYGELTWEVDLKERVDYFHFYVDQPRDSLKDMLILDAGCGNGTLSAAIAATGARVVAMDYSSSVEAAHVKAAQMLGNNDRELHFVQGDVQHPPFAKNIFDIIYSDGVLHHTDSTKKSFIAIIPMLKKQGKLFVWLYRSDLKGIYRIKNFFVMLIRYFLRPFPRRIQMSLCFIGAIILNTQLRIRSFVGFKTRRLIPLWLKTLNLFDTFTPRYNHVHTPAEVKGWFTENGFPSPIERTVPKLGHGGFGMLGTKD